MGIDQSSVVFTPCASCGAKPNVGFDDTATIVPWSAGCSNEDCDTWRCLAMGDSPEEALIKWRASQELQKKTGLVSSEVIMRRYPAPRPPKKPRKKSRNT